MLPSLTGASLCVISAQRKASRLHNRLGSSTARSAMSNLTARTDPRAHTNGANYRRGRKDAVPHSPISGPVAEIKPLSYYSRAARQGKGVAKLLDASNTGAPVDPTAALSLSQSLHVYKPDSGARVVCVHTTCRSGPCAQPRASPTVRGELEADWDLRHPRHQTELTRYVDVVLRQNLAPFQSTAMMP